MISIDQEDLAILKDILKKYPLTIYAYGSRVKNKHTKFSDLDLCVFDDTYKKLDLFNLKEDLKDSNLPFTVDVIAWSSMSESFQGLIKNDLTLLQSNPALLDCEENFLSKISYLSQKFDFNIIQNQDYILIDSGINSSMFNVIYQKNQSVLPAEEVINYYKGQNFAWWFGSSGWQSSMIKILTENRFETCLGEYCMGLEISDVYEVSSSITIKNITTIQGLKDYSGIIEEYSNVASRVYLNKKIIEPGFITKTPFLFRILIKNLLVLAVYILTVTIMQESMIYLLWQNSEGKALQVI